MINLPDQILLEILKYFTLFDLVQVINRTCTKLNILIKNNTILWRQFQFDFPITINEDSLKYITAHSRQFTNLEIGSSDFQCSATLFDYYFSKYLLSGKHLVWLNLSKAPLSTLCFLKDLPNLEVLDVSYCKNLQDCDVCVIKHCKKIEQLYISYLDIQPVSLLDIIHFLPHIFTIDASGIKFNIVQIEELLSVCYDTLYFFDFSLQTSVLQEQFTHLIQDVYIDCMFKIHPE